MTIMRKVLKQCRKPSGCLGRMLAWGMNLNHAKLTGWELSHISIPESSMLLDVGCGGGGTIHKLARMVSRGKVCEIDYSEDSVRISRKSNKAAIKAGHVDIRQGSVSSLPFPHDMFDLITAIETHYFWLDLVNDMKEVLRVLKPAGTLLIMGG